MEREIINSLEQHSRLFMKAFGSRPQMLKTIEEMCELAQKLCKRLNDIPVSDVEICDEVADVLICAYQMRILFGTMMGSPRLVDDRILFKLDRTLKYIQIKGLVPQHEIGLVDDGKLS